MEGGKKEAETLRACMRWAGPELTDGVLQLLCLPSVHLSDMPDRRLGDESAQHLPDQCDR